MATKKFWKLSKAQSKLLFAFLGISAVAVPTGAIIYSVMNGPTYVNKDPWADAIDLNPTLNNYFNEKLTKNKTKFKVGESKGVGIYVNKNDISEINSLLRDGGKWIGELSEVEKQELVNGTGASFNEEGKLYFKGKEMKELALFPTILEYPYDGDDKFGEVSFSPSDKQSGLFRYNVRLCLRLGAIDNSGNKYDLKKDYDFTINYDQDIKLGELLTLMNNDSVKSFVSRNQISQSTSNETILKGLLATYYNLSNNEDMDFSDQITPAIGSLPSSNQYNSDRANAETIHVKYNSRNINSFDRFGANLFDKHIDDYDSIETIFNKIGISMPTFTNDIAGFQLRNRESGSWNGMSSNDLNSYKGYINYGGDYSSITDDKKNSLFKSEHKIFNNKVNIEFLDVNKSTDFYYDQQPYSRGNVNYNNYNIASDVKNALNEIKYNDSESNINGYLSSTKTKIENSIQDIVRSSLSNNGVDQNVLKSVSVTPARVSSFSKPSSGTNKNATTVFFDKTASFESASSVVSFHNYDKSGNTSGETKINGYHSIGSVTIKDSIGRTKNQLGNIKPSNISDTSYDTSNKVEDIISKVKSDMYSKISNWMNGSNTLYEGNEAYNLEYKISGPVTSGKLEEGKYTVTITAPNSIWNFMGHTITNSFHVYKSTTEEVPKY